MSAKSSGAHLLMPAVLIERFGEPSELRQRKVSRPDPQEGEVLVEIHATAVNRSDILDVRGLVPFKTCPAYRGATSGRY